MKIIDIKIKFRSSFFILLLAIFFMGCTNSVIKDQNNTARDDINRGDYLHATIVSAEALSIDHFNKKAISNYRLSYPLAKKKLEEEILQAEAAGNYSLRAHKVEELLYLETSLYNLSDDSKTHLRSLEVPTKARLAELVQATGIAYYDAGMALENKPKTRALKRERYDNYKKSLMYSPNYLDVIARKNQAFNDVHVDVTIVNNRSKDLDLANLLKGPMELKVKKSQVGELIDFVDNGGLKSVNNNLKNRNNNNYDAVIKLDLIELKFQEPKVSSTSVQRSWRNTYYGDYSTHGGYEGHSVHESNPIFYTEVYFTKREAMILEVGYEVYSVQDNKLINSGYVYGFAEDIHTWSEYRGRAPKVSEDGLDRDLLPPEELLVEAMTIVGEKLSDKIIEGI